MKLVKEYLHIDKDSVFELGLPEKQTRNLIGALYEVEFLVDIDTGTIFACNGKILDTAVDYEGPDPGHPEE